VSLTPTLSNINATLQWSYNGSALQLLPLFASTPAVLPPYSGSRILHFQVTSEDSAFHREYNVTLFYAPCASGSSACLPDCVLPLPIPTGIAVGNCSAVPAAGGASVQWTLHAGKSCLLKLADGFALLSGSLSVDCSAASVLQWQPPVTRDAAVGPPLVIPISARTLHWQQGSLPSPSFVIQAASAVPPLTGPADFWLRFRWSYQSQTEYTSGVAAAVLSTAVSSSLSVDPTLLRAGLSYFFFLRVTDADPSHAHSVSGALPMSQMNFTLTVTEALRTEVQSPQNVNPCADSTLCLNGGTCQYEEISGGVGGTGSSGSGSTGSIAPSTYSLWCRCPSTPYSFFGSVCSFALLSCPSCVSPFIGGASVRLYGVGLDSLFRISVAQRKAEFTPATIVDPSTDDREQKEMWNKFGLIYPNLQVLTLITPALVQRNSSVSPADEQTATRTTLQSFARLSSVNTAAASDLSPSATFVSSPPRRLLLDSSAGDSSAPTVLTNPPSSYQLLTLDSALLSAGAPSSSSSFVQVNYTRLLLYTSSSCGVGVWKEDGLGGCFACPAGLSAVRSPLRR
jgi:hypothetical protein